MLPQHRPCRRTSQTFRAPFLPSQCAGRSARIWLCTPALTCTVAPLPPLLPNCRQHAMWQRSPLLQELVQEAVDARAEEGEGRSPRAQHARRAAFSVLHGGRHVRPLTASERLASSRFQARGWTQLQPSVGIGRAGRSGNKEKRARSQRRGLLVPHSFAQQQCSVPATPAPQMRRAPGCTELLYMYDGDRCAPALLSSSTSSFAHSHRCGRAREGGRLCKRPPCRPRLCQALETPPPS